MKTNSGIIRATRHGIFLITFMLSALWLVVPTACGAEPTEIDGRWRRVRTEIDGKPGKTAFFSHFIFYGGTFSGGFVPVPFLVRPDKSPKEADIGDLLAIYRIEGDMLTVCESRTKRPDNFETTGHLDRLLTVFERDEEKHDADLAKCEGNWEIVATRNPPVRHVSLLTATIRFESKPFSNWIAATITGKETKGGKAHVASMGVQLSSSTNPPQLKVNLSMPDGKTSTQLQGVYKLQDDTLKIVLGSSNYAPSTTDVKRTDPYWSLELRRVK